MLLDTAFLRYDIIEGVRDDMNGGAGVLGISVEQLVIIHLMRNPKGFAFTGKRKDNGKVSFNGFLVPLRQDIKKTGFITSN